MPEPTLIATIMRPEGETGVQTHFRAFLHWMQGKAVSALLVTPFDCPRWQVYPVFALRRLIEPLSKTGAVWWYRHWHAYFLRRSLRRELATGRPLGIYAQCPLSAAAALRARTSPDQKVVMVVHFNQSQADEWADKGMIRRDGRMFAAIRRFEADVLPRLDGLVFVSDFMRREILSRIPLAADVPCRLVPNFLADPGLPSDRTVDADLICIGTLEPRKNQKYALEIVAAAARLGRRLSLTLVGDGPDRAMLEALVRKLSISGQVRFAGFVPNGSALMDSHAACLHVARIENFPLVPIEAMARGLPIFAPPVGGVAEAFADGREGRLIPLDDADAAARAVVEWFDVPEKLRLAGRLARSRYLERYEAQSVAAQLLEFLQSVPPRKQLDGQAQPEGTLA